ncbi:putative bifunctional diguanylate cyclase/phosphodiesterase [Desulfogranum mediterraneum]|uniref:putative bifunctional diguanylate cyclase/phosphodiesterase n=1 Tax=Desulfogranum mediterraneum TaxID=160661 RepID=UPI00048DA45E|nr:EAL domain-containing protein [Desulfogranum mediterraneum]
MTNENTLPPAEPSRQDVILVIDDDSAARLLVKFSLENSGFTVLEAANGEEAVASCMSRQPNLILLDVMMSGMDGIATCRALRRLPGGQHIPVVMVTALEDEQTITDAFDAGATDFISKPINLLVLGYRVRYWLRAGTTLQELDRSQERLVKAQEIARLGHWEHDLDGGTFTFSSPSPELFGLSHCGSYEMLFASILGEEKDHIRKTIDQACTRKEPFSVSYRICREDGAERIILNQGEFVNDPLNRDLLIGIIQDITELKQAEDKIRYLAYYDNLTGLANRSLFREHWSRVLHQAQREQNRIAILFIDLDHFKGINDTLGHPSGDKILITVANRLKAIFRPSDIIARQGDEPLTSIISRVGGDEFTVIAVNISTPDNAAKLAERILETVCKPIELEEQLVNLTASVGLSLYPEDGEDIDELLKHADTAMYEAKQGGRNTYMFYQQSMNAAVEARFLLNNRLHRALEQGEFVLYYQPQFSNTSAAVKGVEALIRWIDPERGIIAPNDFLPFAEENGFIHDINTWVIREACSQAQQWVMAGIFDDCRVGVNISGNNINFSELFATITETLHETGLHPRHLEVELTERVMMEQPEEAVRTLLQLKELGVAIAIDDFGTGYSALSHLQLFPLTTLKIDKSFVHNIDTSENGLSLLHSIINIAKSFNLSVVAEGVETERQRSALQELDCDDLQGFLLSKPAPVEAIERLLTSAMLVDPA